MSVQHSPSAADALHPELKEYSDQLMRVTEDVRVLAARLDDDRINWTPEPGKWSIGQHLDHLNKVGRIYLPFLEEASRDGRERGLMDQGPYRYGWLSSYILRLAEPPPRRRFRAPRPMQPAERIVAAEVLVGFLTFQDELRACLRAANGVDLARVKVPSPVTALLRLPLGQAFAIVAAHERRHVWHAWQIRKRREFPDPDADSE